MNGHAKAVIATVLAILGIAAGPLAVYDTLSKDTASTKTKLESLEKRQAEDRREVRERVQRIDDRTQRVEDSVNQILRKMDVIEDRRRESERKR